MIYEYYTSVLISLWGVALIYSIWQKRKDTASMEKQKDESGRSTANGECLSDNTKRNDVIIVGAGVAGSALAYTLGKDGRQVHVIERDLAEPDRIVGEFLQPGGYLKLIELGLEDCVTEIDAQQVIGYAFYKNGKFATVSFSLNSFHSDVAGRSFHHGRFIQKLRKKAASLPNVKLEQGTVTSLLKEKGTVKGVQYKTKTDQNITAYASLTIVCDGCFSNLRRSLCNPKIKVLSHFVGWVMENCQLPCAKHTHIILSEPAPILIYPISSTATRCLVEVAGQRVPSVSNGALIHYMKNVMAPQIPPELYSAFVSTIDKGNIKVLPNWSMSTMPYFTPGAFLIGDALNMRHPIIGSGMTVALSDVVILRDLLRPVHNLNDASALCKHLQSFYTLRKPMAITMNTLAAVVYRVYCTPPNLARKELQQAGFECLSLGDVFASRVVTLSSGINPSRMSLLLIFCHVTIYCTGQVLLPFPSPKRLSLGARLIWGTIGVIFATMKADGVKQLSSPRKSRSDSS